MNFSKMSRAKRIILKTLVLIFTLLILMICLLFVLNYTGSLKRKGCHDFDIQESDLVLLDDLKNVSIYETEPRPFYFTEFSGCTVSQEKNVENLNKTNISLNINFKSIEEMKNTKIDSNKLISEYLLCLENKNKNYCIKEINNKPNLVIEITLS